MTAQTVGQQWTDVGLFLCALLYASTDSDATPAPAEGAPVPARLRGQTSAPATASKASPTRLRFIRVTSAYLRACPPAGCLLSSVDPGFHQREQNSLPSWPRCAPRPTHRFPRC